MFKGKANAQTVQWLLEHKEPCIVVGYGNTVECYVYINGAVKLKDKAE